MTTRNMLRMRVAQLNKALGRSEQAWTKKDGQLISNEGHFLLAVNSPGDGWTRYRLNVITGEHGGQCEVSPCCTASEMKTYLRGVMDVVDGMRGYNPFFKSSNKEQS